MLLLFDNQSLVLHVADPLRPFGCVEIVPYHGYSALYIVFGCALVLHLEYFIRDLCSVFTLKDLLNGADVDLKDSSRVNVEADIFDELLRSAKVSFKVSTELSAESEVSD
ncbi:unnamed protein product, partial [Arctogadus glacialis]